MRPNKPLKPPSLVERLTLRFMIILAMVYMFFFLRTLLHTSLIDFAPLFWMLIVVLSFYCFKLVLEWVHYFYITIPPTPQVKRTYTVDVFTTFCAGEPYPMIVETLEAIKAITYPHETYLCDEADDPYLKKLCAELGIHHVTRIQKIDAKAGNINNALGISSGELCVVLDPDHVPFPNFLDPIISHFDNPEIGFVQIVQAYKNYDKGLIAKGAAQQTFQFYGPIMMSMNKFGTVLAIGANCTFRRTALESIGGHSAGLAEDMHTAMQLHAKGWKSVYAPHVLARGLVPDTLSAYYSQQLKWSRGVFELFVTSYPKLFKQFTWQQKLHYGLIPVHYLSGIIFLLNFLIPILSLILNKSPININLVDFAILGTPLVFSIVLIRHYVQTWVMEDDERGFHIVGGLLMLGTWWIYILGFFYTVIRKKIPYIPTPKDGKEGNNWYLNIPNIILIVVSLFAIFWGISNDWSPYTLIMSAFAALNCLILSFSILASRQHHFRRLRSRNTLVYNVTYPLSRLKNIFWRMRHKIYRRIKWGVLPLTLVIAAAVVYFYEGGDVIKEVKKKPDSKDIFLSGIFAPQTDNGLSSVRLVNEYQAKNKLSFSIISFYLAWGDGDRSQLPLKQLDSVYANGSIPMISWEPWQSLFSENKKYADNDKESKVFARIIHGDYDAYLERFSSQIASLNRPVYLRFAHEADNPFYPWSGKGGNTPAEFKKAWIYIHDFFEQKGVYNVAWVWNPWKADAVSAYFPGKDYVDWIGVTNLNYGLRNPDKKWYTMEQLYDGFHKNAVFRSGIPVMLAEMGSLRSEAAQGDWFKQAVKSIYSKYPEIKAVVLFNSEWDKNVIDSNSVKYDWRIEDMKSLASLIKIKDGNLSKNTPAYLKFAGTKISSLQSEKVALNQNIHGVNYTRGQDWLREYRPLRKRDIINDFTEMKSVGINAVNWYGPTIYDQNIISVARQENLNVNYSFWIPDYWDPTLHESEYAKLTNEIIENVVALKKNKAIMSWHIGNNPFQMLANSYYKPQLFYQQQKYLNWLRLLIIGIKKADPTRAVTIDVIAYKNLLSVTDLITRNIPEIDAFGIVADKDFQGRKVTDKLKVKYFFSKIEVKDFIKYPKNTISAFITNWQDQENRDFLTLSGLKDNWDNKKFSYYQLRNCWIGTGIPKKPDSVRILLPALLTYENTTLTYYALVKRNDSWVFATDNSELTFKWVLVKNDEFGNPLTMKPVGSGTSINLLIPKKPMLHRLYLYIDNGHYVNIVSSQLNTPLY